MKMLSHSHAIKSAAIILYTFACGSVLADGPVTLKIGVAHNPPITTHEYNGEVGGLAVDVMSDIASKNGWTLNYVSGDWTDLIRQLNNAELDLQTGVAYSEDRAKLFDFNQQALIVNWGVLYRNQHAGFSSAADLQDEKVAMVGNSTHAKAFNKLLASFGIQAVMVDVPDYEQAFKKIEEGEIKFAVVSRLYGIQNSDRYKAVETGMNFNPIEVRFAAPKGKNADVLQAIDRYLESGKSQIGSDYQQYLHKHLTAINNGDIPKLVFWIAVISCIALGLSVLLLWGLKREVTRRTTSLQASESKLIEAQFISRTGDFQWNLKENLVSCSKGLNFMLGKEDSPPLALEEALERSVHPDDVELFKTWIADGLKSGKKSLGTRVFRLVCNNGDILNAETMVSIAYKNGVAVWILGIFHDVTERVQSEKTMTMALESAVAANSAKSVFLATMSHELRTPLNAILGFTQLLQIDEMNRNNPLSEAQKGYIDNIYVGGTHLLNLVNDILDVTQIESDHITLTQEITNINTVVRDCINQIFALSQQRGVEIRNLLDDKGEYEVLADGLRVKQVMLNLLSNAINYNRVHGKITITSEKRGDSFLRILVTDTGIGIADKFKPDVFKAFNRLGADSMLTGKGTGIGLTISKVLIEKLGGKIGFESNENVGSTFWFELPLAKKEQAEASHAEMNG